MAIKPTVHTAIKIDDIANDCPKFSDPGWPKNRSIAIGSVKKPELGRTIKLVAPNSPILTVKANTDATAMARPIIGKSTSRHTWDGRAPIVAAASRRLG